MSVSEDSLVTSYCVGLASAFQRLSHDLLIPRIDQELYTDLFIHPLEDQQCGNDGPSTTSSASDMQAEALVSLGAAELIVSALRTHEQQTQLALQAIALRESVVSRMWSCCEAYDETAASAAEEARFTFLRLLQEHQLATLLTVESIFEWREMLSRPYPFFLRGGENYLLSIIADCTAFDSHALVRSLANVCLRQDPLCAKVDLQRMLHRLETMHRSRLITTGALWNVGLQPLTPLPARGGTRSRSRSADARRPPSAGRQGRGAARRSATRSSLPILRAPWPPTTKHDASCFSHFHGSKPDEFVSQVARLNSALKKHHTSSASGEGGTCPASPTTSTASQHFAAPRPPRGGAAGVRQRQRQHRLLTAARIIEKEAALYRTVIEELYELAHRKGRFVPLLDIPQLFTKAEAKGDYPADSWPLDRAQWPSLLAAEGRVDRLGCMSTARDALQTCDLLPAWQQRMGRRASDVSGNLLNRSKTSVTSVSTPAEGPLTPLHSSHTLTAHATNTTTAIATSVTHSSTYSNGFEHTSSASAPEFAVDTRLPLSAPAEDSPSASLSSSATASTSFSSSASAPVHAAAAGRKGSREAAHASTHSEAFSSDFESESEGDDDPHDTLHAATPLKEDQYYRDVSASSPASSLEEEESHGPSLDELRAQLLAEHRLNSRSQSYSL
jgi:hypothetical protein